jgi:hypothetical protein
MKNIYFLLLLSIISFNCQKELSNESGGTPNTSAVVPTLTTTTATSITNTTVATGGTINTDGGATITARGVCWATTTNPVITINQHTIQGTGTGVFTTTITSLTANTVYYARAYATNSAGTAYGNEISFTTTTTSTALPTVTTSQPGSITALTASGGGTVVTDGGATVTVRGICWATTANPVATGNHTTDGAGIGTFAGFITGLTAGTTYHVRAYATNSVGTAYGGDSVFTTTGAAGLPTITTTTVTAINKTDATGGGNVTTDGGSPVTARGVCWSNVANPVATGNHTTDGTGTGAFISAIAGLTKNTTYYVRAFATNSNGTAYGNQIVITTPEYDVYVGGSAYYAGMVKLVATIWKNGLATLLTDGTNDAYIYSLVVTNSDVYAGGIEHNGTNWVAKIWKNGVATTLTDGTHNGNVQSVFISGADVYVAGSDDFVAKIWKNGVAATLPGGTTANSVYVSGSDVYVCGEYWIGGNQSYAVTWKNGIFTDLTDRSNLSNATSIFVSGPDVYIGGRFGLDATLWKNGVVTNLSNGPKFNMVTAVTVNASGVYAAGFQLFSPGGVGTVKYWKNNVATNVTNGTFDAKVKSFFVFGTNVFVCGSENDVITIWKNSVPTIINIPMDDFRTIYLY